jgi:KipI family sensor histidine kinase inhibitor
MRIRPVGDSALLLEFGDDEQVEAWRADLWRRRETGEFAAAEIVPAERTLLLDGVDPVITSWLRSMSPPPAGESLSGSSLVEIPTTFDGEDLADVAAGWNISVAEAVERLAGTELTVAFCGFAPGFAYLRGLREEWAVPRLAAPRARVPAGAVALAGAYAGIYPAASPGGWRLVGHTTENLFDVRAEPPALLTPGTRVRLVRR